MGEAMYIAQALALALALGLALFGGKGLALVCLS